MAKIICILTIWLALEMLLEVDSIEIFKKVLSSPYDIVQIDQFQFKVNLLAATAILFYCNKNARCEKLNVL